MNSKAFRLFNALYIYFQVSFYFWIYLLRGLVIYSLIPASVSLLLTVREIDLENDEQQIKHIFSKHFNKFKQYKLASFIFSLVMLTSFSSLFLLNRLESSYSLILTILVIYILVIIVLLFTYTIFYLGDQEIKFKQTLIISFVSMIKNIVLSIAVLVIISALLAVAYFNFLLFIIIGPFLYGIAINIGLHKLLEDV